MAHGPAGLTKRWGWLIVLVACGTEHAASDASEWRPVATAGTLAVYDALAPASPAPDVASLYFTVINRGPEPDTLLRVHTDRGMAELHEVVTEAGLSSMRHVHRLPLLPGDTLRLMPGSYHVMITRLDRPLLLSDTLHVTLEFARVGALPFDALVLSYTDVVQRLEQRSHDRR
jgi:copper(I)-binding protein